MKINKHKEYYVKNKLAIIAHTNEWHRKRDDGLFFKYLAMTRRCKYKSQANYKYYGGRGIKVEWENYIDFYRDMYSSYIDHLKTFGKKQTTLDRIDVNGNYCKENCRWTTLIVQANNKKKKLSSLNI